MAWTAAALSLVAKRVYDGLQSVYCQAALYLFNGVLAMRLSIYIQRCSPQLVSAECILSAAPDKTQVV